MSDSLTSRSARLVEQPFVAASGPGPFFGGTLRSLRELWERRELQGILVRREMKNRYKDSALGFIWTLIKPVTMLAIYWFAIGQLLGAARSIPSFAIFVFAGLTLWGLYSDILATSTMSILQNAALIKKVYLPREVFPLASVGSAFLNFLVQLGVLLVACAVFLQFPLHPDLIYALPAIAIVLIYGTALALILSAVNVYLRDVQYLVDVLVVMLFWASPIVYSYANVAGSWVSGTWIEQVYLANPVTVAVLAFQRAIWLHGPAVQAEFAAKHIDPASTYPPDLALRLLVVGLVGLVLVWFAHRVFSRLQADFAQEI
jgi:ABC-2 type transport system permease protein